MHCSFALQHKLLQGFKQVLPEEELLELFGRQLPEIIILKPKHLGYVSPIEFMHLGTYPFVQEKVKPEQH